MEIEVPDDEPLCASSALACHAKNKNNNAKSSDEEEQGYDQIKEENSDEEESWNCNGTFPEILIVEAVTLNLENIYVYIYV